MAPVLAASTSLPNGLQPSPTSETRRPDLPSVRYCNWRPLYCGGLSVFGNAKVRGAQVFAADEDAQVDRTADEAGRDECDRYSEEAGTRTQHALAEGGAT